MEVSPLRNNAESAPAAHQPDPASGNGRSQSADGSNIPIRPFGLLGQQVRTTTGVSWKVRLEDCESLDGAETVRLSRHPRRPRLGDYVELIVTDFLELHGDRSYGDDRSLVTAFGRIAGHRVMLVGHNKGRDTKDGTTHCSGYAHPEGYRKALSKMKLAEKFRLPIVTWIDTPGAYPGVGAEERGIAHSLAINIREMSRLRVPIICVVIGEGGSGGALGIGVGDRLAMFKHSYFSVITPEGCAAILFRTTEMAPIAANELSLRACDLKRLDLIDDILDEPLGGAHCSRFQAADVLESYLSETLRELSAQPIDSILVRRYERIRRLGSAV